MEAMQNEKGRREAGLSDLPNLRRGSEISVLQVSVLGDDRATPVEAVVQAGLDDVVVIAGGAEGGQRRGGEGGGAEIVVLVLDLARPILGEHVFETGADGVTVMTLPGDRDSRASDGQRIAVVGVGITAL